MSNERDAFQYNPLQLSLRVNKLIETLDSENIDWSEPEVGRDLQKLHDRLVEKLAEIKAKQ